MLEINIDSNLNSNNSSINENSSRYRCIHLREFNEFLILNISSHFIDLKQKNHYEFFFHESVNFNA